MERMNGLACGCEEPLGQVVGQLEVGSLEKSPLQVPQCNQGQEIAAVADVDGSFSRQANDESLVEESVIEEAVDQAKGGAAVELILVWAMAEVSADNN